VAFCIANFAGFELINASYTIVMNYQTAEVEQVLVGWSWGLFMSRVDGLKPHSTSEMLLSFNLDQNQGPAFMWNWKSGDLTELSQGSTGSLGSSHDMQWVYDDGTMTPAQSDAYWRTYVNGFYRMSASDPDDVVYYNLYPSVDDVNHVQMLEEDRYALLSSRMDSSFVKFDVVLNKTVWKCGGGTESNFSVVDFDGTVYPAFQALNGALPWSHQHNAEYFGEGEMLMFDNHYKLGSDPNATFGVNNSRLLSVTIDEDTMIASLTWEFLMPGHELSPVFGDADRLPTGNVLGCMWPSILHDGEEQFDARVFEVVRDEDDLTAESELAWDMTITGHTCNSERSDGAGKCIRYQSEGGFGAPLMGWAMYSVERFYAAPLVHALSCKWSDDTQSYVLAFNVNTAFKQSSPYAGQYVVTAADGSTLSGVVNFASHWRDASVSITLTESSQGGVSEWAAGGSLTVTESGGDSTNKAFACSGR
jgi:hypothetical protein